MEYSHVFDIASFEKATAACMARFNLLSNLRKLLEIAAVLGMISWSTACVPPAVKTAAGHAVRCSAYLLNHHVVFLIGNFIIVCLFVLFRRNDAAEFSASGDMYDDYVRNREPPPPGKEEKRNVEETVEVACVEETAEVAETVTGPPCDEVAAAIEKAERQIRRFQRTQSEKLRREIGARPRVDLRRSESDNRRRPEGDNRRRSVCSGDTLFGRVDEESDNQKSGNDNRRRSVSSGEKLFGTVDMERLSSEDFQRTVDAFISKHWKKKMVMEEDLFELRNIIY